MLLKALFSHYRRHPWQLLALWLILTLASSLWTGVWTLTQQARTGMVAGEQQLAGRQQVVRADGVPVTREDFVTLRRQGLCVMPWLEVIPADGGSRQIGVDILSMACAGGAAAAGDDPDLDGRPFLDMEEAVRRVRDEGASGQFRLHIVAGQTGLLPATWTARPEAGQLSTGQLTDSFLLNLDALNLLVLLITALLVRSVYTLGLAQRRQGLRLLLRYGVPGNRLRAGLLLELLMLGVLALIPGLWLGGQLAGLLSAGFASALANLFDAPLLTTSLSPGSLLVIAGVMGLVLLWVALDLFRDPDEAPRLSPFGYYFLVSALVLSGALLVLLTAELLWLFAGTALLLAGTGLLTPRLLTLGLSAGSRSPSDPLRLWRDREAGVLVRRLALPLVALQFALAAVIAVQALVTTFEDTFHQWLDQRLSGDLSIEVPQADLSAQVQTLLDHSPAVRYWHPVIRGEGLITLAGQAQIPVSVTAANPRSPLLHGWKLISAAPEPWQQLEQGDVLINEQLARRHGLSPGDSFELEVRPGGAGRLPVRVAGVYADYGRPSGQLLMSWQHLPETFVPRSVSLTLSFAAEQPQDERERLRRQLMAEWKVMALQERDSATVRRIAVTIFGQTFALTRAVSLLTLALATAALLLTGWVVLRTRAWYLHLLVAWGLSSGKARQLLRQLITGLMIRLTLVSVPPGVVLTWILVARINPVAFGWALPMAVYPLFWLQLLVLMLLAGWLAGQGAAAGKGGLAPVRGQMLAAGGTER